ncbi:tetratricopeptide repeat protein [Roseomonas sp. F4]
MRQIRSAVLGSAFGIAMVLAALVVAPSAHAQMESREGIALQNQILQLRQEVEMLRRGGSGGAVLPAPAPSPSALGGRSGAQGGAPQTELVGALLDRVQRLEEELRILRGRADEADFRARTMQERLEKLEGDVDFRLQQLEGQRQGNAAPPARPGAPAVAAAPATAPAAAAAPRTPQRALAEGQAALGRRDWPAAEAAAREVIAARDATRIGDAQLLLGGALAGKRDFAGAAVAYDDAYRRSPQGTRAPEAMLGVANALIGLNNNRDACNQLNDLRTRFPQLRPAVAERATEARRRAQCR